MPRFTLSSTGPVRTKFPLEPATSLHPLHVARNLLIGLATFICVDGVVFSYQRVHRDSGPRFLRGANGRPYASRKGSRFVGAQRGAGLGRFANGGGILSSACQQAQLCRRIQVCESHGIRFRGEHMGLHAARSRILRDAVTGAIVVPYGIGFEPSSADPLRISMAAPLLRYGDCFNFASAFQRWSGRFRAFTACILRGSAFQSERCRLLAHPIARMRRVQQEPKRLQARDIYKGRDYDIVGTSYDPKTGQVTFPPRLSEAQRDAIRDSLVKPSQSETQDFLRMQRDGIQRILNRYSTSSDRDRPYGPYPRGPFAGAPGSFHDIFTLLFPPFTTQRAFFHFPEQTFDFLEKPEYYFDGYHLNSKGRPTIY